MCMLLLNVFGGLAIFIFGMKMMSDGLHHVAGEKMQNILRFFASNRFVAILSGTVVTAIIQSSSASTVMVIGFVNAGLLNLTQSIGIIFGANIGTTITAQLVAFEIGWVVMPAIIAGLLLSFIERPVWKGWGETVIGFGFLFLGMTFMSDQLKTLSADPAFMAWFSTFDCAPRDGWIPPGALLGAIGIGLGATLLIQSSSACTGIVIALGAGGIINLYTAVALVLGSNIGTTVTAQLAAITANRIAKQAALAHTLFNTIGVLVIVSTFWFKLSPGDDPIFFDIVNRLSEGGDLPRQIANAHTLFNVCTTLLLTAFIPQLARFCEWCIPQRTGKVHFQRLEPLLLDTPQIALQQSVATLNIMVRKAWKMIDQALSLEDKPDDRTVRRMDRREEKIDTFQKEITQYLAQLMQRRLSEAQADAIPLVIHCANDAERIGDHTGIVLELRRQYRNSNVELSAAASAELEKLHKILTEQASCTMQLLEHYQQPLQLRAAELEKTVDSLCVEFESNHIKRLSRGKCRPVAGLFYIQLLAEYRKVSQHLGNISERAGNFSTNIEGKEGA